jgi:hypothetical protein
MLHPGLLGGFFQQADRRRVSFEGIGRKSIDFEDRDHFEFLLKSVDDEWPGGPGRVIIRDSGLEVKWAVQVIYGTITGSLTPPWMHDTIDIYTRIYEYVRRQDGAEENPFM